MPHIIMTYIHSTPLVHKTHTYVRWLRSTPHVTPLPSHIIGVTTPELYTAMRSTTPMVRPQLPEDPTRQVPDST